MRLEELKNLLLTRGYRPGVVNGAVEKARNVPRQEALKKVERKTRRGQFL